MKCPFRKIIKHEEKYANRSAEDIEEFAECYKEECPFYEEWWNGKEYAPTCAMAGIEKRRWKNDKRKSH